MIKCKFCGAENPDGTRFCSYCGGKTAIVIKSAPERPVLQKIKNPLKIGPLIWSIINIVLGIFGILTFLPFSASILGVIALILVILAQDCQNPKDEKTRIRIAIILNIIASAILVISVALLIAFLFMELYMPLPATNSPMDIESFMEMYPSLD